MGYVADLLLGIWLLANGWWLVRRGALACVHSFVGVMLGYVSAVVMGLIVDALIRQTQLNWWLHGAIVLAVGSMTLALVVLRWQRYGAQRLTRWSVHRWAFTAHLLLPLLVLMWCGAQVILWVLAVNIMAAASPVAAVTLHERTLVTRWVIRPSVVDPLESQQRALRGVRGGFAAGLDRLLDASGAQRAMAIMDALIVIAALDASERERLVRMVPELNRLSEDPALLAVCGDQRVMNLVGEAAEGSMSAVYALGGEPSITLLAESPAMRAALVAVDPVVLRRMIGSADNVGRLRWQVSHIASSLDLDAQLNRDSGWEMVPGELVAWPDGIRYGVARSTVPMTAGEIDVVSDAECSLWVEDQLLCPQIVDGHRCYHIPAARGERSVVLMLDFGGLDGPRLGRLRLFSEARPTPY